MMESESFSGSSFNPRTKSSTNSNETELFNSEKKQELSQDHIHFMPNATITTPHIETSTFVPINDQTNSSMMESNHANPFGDFHPSYPNNSDHSSTSSSQNPFLLLSDDATNLTQSQNLHDQVPFESSFHQPSTYESSLGNPFQVPTSASNDSQTTVEHHDHWSFLGHEETEHPPHYSSSSQQIDPLITLESTKIQELHNANAELHDSSPQNALSDTQQMHDSRNSSSNTHQMRDTRNALNTKEDTDIHPKPANDFHLAAETSDYDIPISSMPKNEQESSIKKALIPETIQNPPIQIMERQEEPNATTTSSTPRIPLHVFTRNKSNNQWSTASNESLFSIQMGKSFSNEMAWMNKSGELDKPVDQSNHHSSMFLPPQGTKFNDISQSIGEQGEGSSRVTEAKAAETMREVIMETSSTPVGTKSKGELTFSNATTRSSMLSSSINDYSQHSDGSTKSFAFKVISDADKTPTSKRGEETRKQIKQSGQQNVKATSAAASHNPKSAPPNASQNKWLSCFTCCH